MEYTREEFKNKVGEIFAKVLDEFADAVEKENDKPSKRKSGTLPWLPTSFEEAEMQYKEHYDVKEEGSNPEDNVYPTTKEFRAYRRLREAVRLRDIYNGEPIDDWCDRKDEDQNKRCIARFEDELDIDVYTSHKHLLAFKNDDLARVFIKNFKDLLLDIKPLM